MLEIVLFLWGIGKEQETEGGVLTGQFWPTDATRSQHRRQSHTRQRRKQNESSSKREAKVIPVLAA